MFKLIKLVSVLILFASTCSIAQEQSYGIGTPPTQAEIAGWDIDVRPDGLGLPAGSGSVEDGEMLYEEKCASCHGSFGEGMDRWPILAGGFDSLTEDRPEKTVGSYWPFVSTLWDYIHRAMPFLQPQSLEDDEVYAITAYVLYLNDLVADDFILSKESFAGIELPNELAFVDDPRPDVQNPRCMMDCKDPERIKVTWDSTDLGVTPTEHLQQEDESTEVAVVENQLLGEDTYKAACAVCHDAGVAGAPKVGDASGWINRLEQGVDILVEHAINGYQGEQGFMPAKGGNPSLSDEQVQKAVEYMTDLVN